MLMSADRLRNVKVSASAAMTDKARELRAQGIGIISLSSGEPDFPTPLHAIEAAHKAALAGDTKYPPQPGTPALRAAIQRKFKRDNNLDYAIGEILVANGGKQIIFNALLATCNPGDEVIIPSPGWITYADIAYLAEATPIPVPCPENNGFKLRPEDIEAAITPRTKWLILNFPNNPTGAACTRDEMRAIAEVLLRHPHVLILTDDIYEHLTYDGFKFCTLAEVEPALRDRVLTVNGVSKAYAMTGWRVGYCGGPKSLIDVMNNVHGQATGGITTVSQAAAVAVLDGPQDLLKERATIYQARRDLVVELLNAIPGITCHKPEGAFYVYPNIASCIGKTTAGGRAIETDTDFVSALLEEAHVAAVPGSAYGMSPHFRISYATDIDSLKEGCLRIAQLCAGLSS
ncbi:pyridoxal phosphate-dependent aminotransferase [Chelatococcus asaccharovorans]|uniref:Aminotransferase n=1 Tax=Chelatococcus asaccharovorans TaxID=28210 RepID=A0A2V3U3C2_9HYPH|nr:pyridoxal phosphate-dependent aminotransferase [Chelatococcus asaccharovorans]MBS7702787.1 pyridoxal phosphate-dependent aminotransferase [Chelatococcus asaccharovorans]PXW57079.1 aspartate aminotransferase [Chelatococcus asaccharovorans]